jgi:type IX secretion system PorP/SprF family membrane protein
MTLHTKYIKALCLLVQQLKSILTALSVLLFHLGNAQDIHFSQFSFSPMNVNPAYTALFDGDVRFVGNYRNQWFNIPVNYNTVSISADGKVYQLKNSDKIGGGISFYYDRAGDSRFTSLQALAQFSYLLNFGKDNKHTIGAGFNVGVGNRSVQYQYLYFDNQYNGDRFDGNLLPNEDFPKSTFTYPDIGAGLSYQFRKSTRQNFVIGFSMQHLNQAAQSFFDDKSVKLNIRYTIHSSFRWKVHKKLDIVPQAFFQSQDTKYELALGFHTKAYIFRQKTANICLNTGLYYRNNDAVYFLIGMDYNAWQVNLSYDINTSRFKPATNTYGAVEASVIYILSKIKNVNSAGSDCEIF